MRFWYFRLIESGLTEKSLCGEWKISKGKNESWLLLKEGRGFVRVLGENDESACQERGFSTNEWKVTKARNGSWLL